MDEKREAIGPQKTAVIVTGPESVGSTLIARIIATSLGLSSSLQDWTGRGQIGDTRDQTIVVHRSMPFGADCDFLTLGDWERAFPDYRLKFVLCTRDRTISSMSNIARRNKNIHQQFDEVETALRLMKDILLSGHPVCMWSYETFMLLRGAYLETMYTFIGPEARRVDVLDSDLMDGNVKFIQTVNKTPHYFSAG